MEGRVESACERCEVRAQEASQSMPVPLLAAACERCGVRAQEGGTSSVRSRGMLFANSDN